MTLKSHGFIKSNDREYFNRLIVSVSGLEKCGKTHFSLTAPDPIALFSTDIGEEGVVDKFENEKQIWIRDVSRVEDETDDAAELAVTEWEKFKEAYLSLLRGSEVRTIIFDTATELWELLRMARFGRLTQIRPHHYGPVNREYRDLIREAYKWDKNLILLHKMKTQYVNDKRTGEWERAGFSDTGFLVQINAQVYRYDIEDGGDFCFWIKDCRQQPELAGEVLEGDAANFQMLAMSVMPKVDPSEWI